MNEPRVIQATFADWRTVKGRKQLQLIFEVPLEQQELVLKFLGAPLPYDAKWYAIARLADAPVAQLEERRASNAEVSGSSPDGSTKRQWADLAPAQQAGIRCNEPRFHAFLREKGFMTSCATADDAATYVRFVCGVDSRAKIGKDSASLVKWKELEVEYQAWLIEPGVAA